MLGQIVREKREGHRWSQSELARRAGLTPGYINQIESGKRPNPGGKVLAALAKAFGVTIDDLLKQTDTALPPLENDQRLADWPPDMLAKLQELYPDMTADELAAAIELGVDALRRLKRITAGPSQQRDRRAVPPSQEPSPPQEGNPSGSGRISAVGRIRPARV